MTIQRDKVIASAEKLVARGKIEAAIKEYERLLEDNPSDVNTLNRIGDLWVRVNRNDEAVKVFTKIADHYSRDGFFLKAIAIYKKINKLDPSKLEIYAKLADLYAKQGLAMEAKSQYQVLADYYLKHGDPANALAIYRKISELDPNSINVHVKLADLYSANSQTAEALKEYDRVGRMLLKRGMLDEAVQVFRKALKIDAKNVELVESLVTALIEARNVESAAQIVEAALETNRENPRLLALLGRVQLARGNPEGARQALERGLAADPNDALVRESLAELHLKRGQADPALEMLYPLAEKAVARGERGAAVEMLNRVLRVDPQHTPTLERVVALYMRLNEETNILASMNSLAEAHITRGSYEEAARVLERLIQREPQNAQHRNKLGFVRTQMGGTDTVPARPKTVDRPMPSMEIEEPPPSFDIGGDAQTFDLGLDSSPGLELEAPAETPRQTVATPLVALKSAVEQAGAPSTEEEDDLDFITEHLTEAEVFAKYGLTEKAIEHLRAVIERSPRNPAAHERLYRILIEEGETDAATTAALRYVEVLRDKGDHDAIDTVRNEFLARGLSLPVAPDAAVPPPAPSTDESWLDLEEPAPSAAEESAAREMVADEDEITFDLDEPAELRGTETVTPGADAEPETLTFDEEAEIDLTPEELSLESSAAAEPTFEQAGEELTFDEASEAPSFFDTGTEDVTQAPDYFGTLHEPAEAEGAAEGAGGAAQLPAEHELMFPEAPVAGATIEQQLIEPEQKFSFGEEAELPSFGDEAIGGDFTASADDFMQSAGVAEPEPVLEEPLAPESAEEHPVAAEPAAEEEAPAEMPFEPAAPEPAFEEPLVPGEEEPAFAAADASELPFAELPEGEESAEPFFGSDLMAGDLLADVPTAEEVGEIDFYISQELFDEARDRVEVLLARYPDDVTLQTRKQRIEAAAAATAPPPPAAPAPVPAPPPVLSRDEIETELLSALPDDDDFATVPAPPPEAQPAPPPPPPPQALHEENLFADEDDFFDLAAELESELGGDDEPISLSEEEQSLEEIFKEFKKGVEQQLDSEDYDTHYNLGIAYKEMGLIDEAIGEFQLASKDPKRSVECSSMLGLCFLEKGMPQLAIKWYRKGLEMPEISQEEHVGLLYDLGSAYMEVGDTQNAQKAFMEVYGLNTNYRDIISRIKQLEGAR